MNHIIGRELAILFSVLMVDYQTVNSIKFATF